MTTKRIEGRLFITATLILGCGLIGCLASASISGAGNDALTAVTVRGATSVSDAMSVSGAIQDPDELEKAIVRAEANYAEKMKEFPPADELISDWNEPDVALIITGRLHGYMEPCGCTGLETQKGGLLRRYAAQNVLRNRGWNLITIDTGNQIQRFGQQPLIKIQKVYQAFCQIMGYDVIGFGVDDYKLPTIDLVQSMMNAQNADQMNDTPFTCGNVKLFDDDTMSSSFRVIERGGKRIGITCILGDEHLPEIRNQSDLTVTDMQTAIEEIMPQLETSNCDMTVLIAHSSLDNCRKLAEKFPAFDLLVTAGGAGDPTLMPEEIVAGDHVTQMIQVGVKGMYVGVVGLYTADGKKEIKYERVPLDYRFEPPIREVNPITEIFIAYQNELKAIYSEGNNQDIRPRQHPSGYTFVGSEKCMDCHDDEFEIWEEGVEGNEEGVGPHALATDSLTHPGERTWVPRNFDPECLSCHVTGWNPEGYFPYISGYMDLVNDVQLHANGCENCHGPGSAHVEAENNPNALRNGFANFDRDRNGGLNQPEFAGMLAANGIGADGNGNEILASTDTDSDGFVSPDEYVQFLLGRLRNEMVLTIEEAKTDHCQSCHDLDNSPEFLKDGGFEIYWAKIKHGDGQ